MTYDPLLDSDEESQDENVRIEYSENILQTIEFDLTFDSFAARRLSVITRLRGRPPTPEPSFEDAPLGRFQQVQSWD
jgi:hypothetical protein